MAEPTHNPSITLSPVVGPTVETGVYDYRPARPTSIALSPYIGGIELDEIDESIKLGESAHTSAHRIR